jgi:hypothetical protein
MGPEIYYVFYVGQIGHVSANGPQYDHIKTHSKTSCGKSANDEKP